MREFEIAHLEFTKVIHGFMTDNNIPIEEMLYIIEASKDKMCQDIILSKGWESADNRILKMMPMGRSEQ